MPPAPALKATSVLEIKSLFIKESLRSSSDEEMLLMEEMQPTIWDLETMKINSD